MATSKYLNFSRKIKIMDLIKNSPLPKPNTPAVEYPLNGRGVAQEILLSCDNSLTLNIK